MARAPTKRTSQRIQRRGQVQPRVVGSTFEPVAASADTVSSPSASFPPRRKTPNQFICFRSWVQTEGPLRNTNSQSNLSEMAAYLWRGMTPEAKRPFLKQAKALSTASRQARSGPSPNKPSQKNSTASAPGKANTRTKNRQLKDSGRAHKLQTPDVPPASSYYRMAPDRIQPQFAGAETTKPIFTPPHLQASSSSSTYYPSLDMSVGRDTTSTEDTDCSFNPHSVFDYLEEMQEENRKQCQAEDEMMKEYLNLDEFED
ncbi:hypothetical protein B0H14DRAFT_2641282 [Mycena olivaceomarginata]|nr:hypothetical protein B0H14DRAFT_2641282 [Mycena olivaceomarginata]